MMAGMKILAVDFGRKRTGLAACDELGITTRLLPVLRQDSPERTLESLSVLIRQEQFPKVLWGLPLNMDGSEGPAARASRKMAEALKEKLNRLGWGGELELWDERLTTFAAEQKLREKGISKLKGKKHLDSLSAQVLLEDYLRSRR